MASDFDDEVEFLDLGADGGSGRGSGGGPESGGADGGSADGVDWLAEPGDEERMAAGRDPRRLPPRASRPRVLASVLSLALVLSAAIGLGTAAYHRHETDVRDAGTLALAASSEAPSLPDLTEVAFAALWHARLAERVVIPVVNKGPDTITLVDGRFAEQGLVGAATLKPLGRTLVPPGGTGELAGTVTADCTRFLDDALASGSPVTLPGTSDGGAYGSTLSIAGAGGSGQPKKGTLQVRGRSADGRLGERTIFPELATSNTADRICRQQGEQVVRMGDATSVVNPRTHAFTVKVTGKSIADIPVDYIVTSTWMTAPGETAESLRASVAPGAASGSVPAGGTFTWSFRITVGRCPSTPPLDGEGIVLSSSILAGGSLVSATEQTVAAQAFLNEACGHPADWKG